ncbi:hypothetical protein [Flavobacterium sp.]|uniref:hypothetical protein n=1 Tax=Flavobacterium sp. TaxID=239 RepID=UPI0033400ADA
MKFKALFLLALVTLACHNNSTELSCDFVEYSFNSGWAEKHTATLDKKGVFTIYKYNYPNYISTKVQLSENEIDSLNILIKKINFKSYNKVANDSCIDCSEFALVLKINNKSYDYYQKGGSSSSEDDFNTIFSFLEKKIPLNGYHEIIMRKKQFESFNQLMKHSLKPVKFPR